MLREGVWEKWVFGILEARDLENPPACWSVELLSLVLKYLASREATLFKLSGILMLIPGFMLLFKVKGV